MDVEGNPDPELNDQGLEAELISLRSQAEVLREELKMCKDELQKLQKQLSQSERLQKTTESYNEDLRQQVDRLSAEIHERKKKERERVDAEVQTEEYTWTETDYYNYYYGGYYPSEKETAAEMQEAVATDTQESSDQTDVHPLITETLPADPEPQDGSNNIPQTEVDMGIETSGESNSIADMLRATAEEALNQTNFVFDETSGMYYDHSTGFYYDSSSQLYYDANTGMYYYYDPESGKYQFHSRIEVPAAHPDAEQTPQRKSKDWKNRKSVKSADRTSCPDGGDNKETGPESDRRPESHHKGKKDNASHKKERRSQSRSPPQSSGTERSRKTKSRDRSRERSTERSRRGRSQGRSRERSTGRRKTRRRSRSRSDDTHSKRWRENGSHSDDARGGNSKKSRKQRRARSRSETRRDRKSRSDHVNSESEPEEGEITGSEGEKERSLSSSSSLSTSSPVQPAHESPEREMEMQMQEEAWPPCVRVTVVRSPVLETGTLFILTADTVATIGRENNMNHAIRIPEMGVSKSHAEVYFDQEHQGYMLIDQGSQNGTVINGNRILQPKVRCDPCSLTHGDEVKMGETVLSFHIHTGTGTCDGCEPGQIKAHLNRHKREENSGSSGVCFSVLSKEDKEIQRQKELKMMKVKYGLKNNDYEEQKAVKNSRYKDRAENRRQTVGSEGAFQRDDAPASVHVEIGDENKGRQMLEKMGWKRGEGLGKDGSGRKDPIQLQLRKAQSGLGSGVAMSVDDASLTKTKTQRNWERARERFTDACQADSTHLDTSQSSNTWVKSQDTE